MDPLSQAVVGNTLAVSFCKKKEWVRAATIAGIVGGLLPDADIVIRSDTDPLLFLEYHRHFTHALAFVPIGGLAAACLCWPLLRRSLPFFWIYVFATLGYATHGILDAMTNYGTHLFWPFTNARESWSIISIVDPVFTITLLALCSASYHRQTRQYALMAAAFACAYWSFGLWQRERATEAMHARAVSRGHTVERSEVKPALGNLILWRAQYQYQGRYYIDAVRVAPWAGEKWYDGGSVEALDVAAAYPGLPVSSRTYADFRRFAFFSDGWVAALPDDPAVVGDMRFAMLPNGLRPLWGIRLDTGTPDRHVEFVRLRESRTSSFGPLWRMLRGEDMLAPSKR